MAKTSKSKSKPTSSVRDIRPKKSERTKTAFKIKQLEDAPSIEPLIEDIEALEEEVNKIADEENIDVSYDSGIKPNMNISSVSDTDQIDELARQSDLNLPLEQEITPKDTIKVKFGTFVQLVANHDLLEIVESNADQEIVMSTNLLTELASTKDQREEKRIPIVFLVGIAMGVVLTYIFFST